MDSLHGLEGNTIQPSASSASAFGSTTGNDRIHISFGHQVGDDLQQDHCHLFPQPEPKMPAKISASTQMPAAVRIFCATATAVRYPSPITMRKQKRLADTAAPWLYTSYILLGSHYSPYSTGRKHPQKKTNSPPRIINHGPIRLCLKFVHVCLRRKYFVKVDIGFLFIIQPQGQIILCLIVFFLLKGPLISMRDPAPMHRIVESVHSSPVKISGILLGPPQ